MYSPLMWLRLRTCALELPSEPVACLLRFDLDGASFPSGRCVFDYHIGKRRGP